MFLRVRFDERVRETLEAAERLLPDEDGVVDALSNASASRAYHAAYLAIADAARRQDRDYPGRDSQYYRHDSFPDDARAWGIISPDESELLRWLYHLRIKADYLEDGEPRGGNLRGRQSADAARCRAGGVIASGEPGFDPDDIARMTVEAARRSS